ncbi:hypothetical protein [Hymenobacter jejuensis]|uniref:Lipoprotein n=1 Tax=Hymenobacter jejuensis TaxID=2502781 RepID=A0A5B8A6I5_9BACT|nr:hypothetical protein [Hymenobacter jejuensis]QDA62296.1 hypothetical protein FHG12_20305 [Hymenobacter jejuensis]
MQRFSVPTLSFVFIASSMLWLTSCNKDNAPGALSTTVSAEDQGLADEENASAGDIIDAASPETEAQSNSATVASADDLARLLSGCATRSYDAATKTLTIDFGTTNCVGPNGVARRGKIIAVFSGPYRQAGATITITPQNYFVNDKQHLGTRVLTNLGNGSFSLDVKDASVVTTEGTHKWSAQRTYTRTAGFGTRTILDDKFTVTGSATGTNRKGVGYSAVITQPLVKQFTPGCARHFTAGIITITNSKEKSMVLNYDPTGTAACDNIASVTINGVTRTVTLR